MDALIRFDRFKKKHWTGGRLSLLIGALILSALACNYPGAQAPTPFPFPTTAAVNPTEALQPTGLFATATGAIFPTATLAPGVAATPTSTAAAIVATVAPPTPVPPTAVPPTKKPVSYAGPEARNGPSVVALYQAQEIDLDGNFDEWNVDKTAVDRIVLGKGEWDGEGDLSARLMMTWDEDYLYLAARVYDDTYVQNTEREELFLGDSLEILLDTNVSADFYYQALTDDDYQLGISPGFGEPGEDPEAYLWFPKSQEGSRQRVRIASQPSEDGYRVEAAIPWSVFDIDPYRGQHFGFAFSVSDNDRARRDEQQTMVSTAPGRNLADPTTWGDLTLSGKEAAVNNPTHRNSTHVEAVYFRDPPALDSNLGEWNSPQYNINRVVYGEDKWDDDLDLSGKAMFGWDEDYLYLAAAVVDNRYMQNTQGEEIFLGDSLEILLDAELEEDYYQRSLSNDDYQLGISPGITVVGNQPEAYLWFPNNEAGARNKVRVSAAPASMGYIIEAAIPWSVFDVQPKRDQTFGFVFSVSDNDHSEKAIQQTVVSIISSRVLTDPTTWADITLVR